MGYRGEPVAEGILGGAGFAFGSAGSGGLLGVAPIGVDAGLGGHLVFPFGNLGSFGYGVFCRNLLIFRETTFDKLEPLHYVRG